MFYAFLLKLDCHMTCARDAVCGLLFTLALYHCALQQGRDQPLDLPHGARHDGGGGQEPGSAHEL